MCSYIYIYIDHKSKFGGTVAATPHTQPLRHFDRADLRNACNDHNADMFLAYRAATGEGGGGGVVRSVGGGGAEMPECDNLCM